MVDEGTDEEGDEHDKNEGDVPGDSVFRLFLLVVWFLLLIKQQPLELSPLIRE
jgi:hypothetical protein